MPGGNPDLCKEFQLKGAVGKPGEVAHEEPLRYPTLEQPATVCQRRSAGTGRLTPQLGVREAEGTQLQHQLHLLGLKAEPNY